MRKAQVEMSGQRGRSTVRAAHTDLAVVERVAKLAFRRVRAGRGEKGGLSVTECRLCDMDRGCWGVSNR